MPRKRATPARRTSRTDDVRRVEERFRRLLAAGVSIFSEHALDRVLQEVVDAARQVVGARYAALGVLSEGGKTLANFVTSGLDGRTRERIGELPHGRGLLGLVIRAAKPIRTADIAHHPASSGFPAHHPAMRSFLGVPIRTGTRVFGNLYLTDKVGSPEFDAEDEGVAVLLAAQAAVAVENARLHEEGERLLAQVRTLQRQRELISAMMNHELRNSLTGVYGWAERLVAGKSPEQAAREVYEGTERAITLLNNFLDLSRLDAGKVVPVWRATDVGAAVRQAVSGFEPAAEKKGLTLTERIPAGCPTLVTDPARLQQILLNLLSNAVRHSPAGGEVRVQARVNSGTIELSVADQGPGVPAELRERIFEPFERFDPESGHGTGLGLSVSRRLAEILGGRLVVQPAGAGAGAEFSLILPLSRAATP